MTIVLPLHYAPCLAYFAAIHQADHLILESKEFYLKQSLRNRCFIATAQGVARLTVPVRYQSSDHLTSEQVLISYEQNWQNTHWRSLKTAYGKAPFFPFFADDLAQIIYQKHERLWDLNLAVLQYCLKILRLPLKIEVSTEFINQYPDTIVDYRNQDITKDYLPKPYIQVFSKGFEPNMSILDALFCVGTETRLHF